MSAGEAVPLSALRMSLGDPAGATWAVDVDGVPGRSLVQNADCAVRFPMRLGRIMSLRGSARLLPHDWRDGSGAVRASITVLGEGQQMVLWTGLLGSAGRGGDPDGLPIDIVLPAGATAVVFDVHQVQARDAHAAARALWREPRLIESHRSRRRERPKLGGRRAAASTPVISVLTPVHDPPLHMLEEAVASVVEQTSSDWELCLVDDGSKDPSVVAALERYAAGDARIKLRRRERAGGIAAATNDALALASGEFVALLDHDDTLAPQALARVAQEIARDPSVDMVYSDEDIVMNGRAVWTHLKPAWSPDTLHTNGYTCHLGVYRRRLVTEIGGFRDEYNGSQDIDMILRLIERSERVAHIPEILYHWRMHAASTAGGDAKPYAYVSARRTISEHLERTGTHGARVDYGPPGLYRVEHAVDPAERVCLVMAPTGADELPAILQSLAREDTVDWTLLLAAPAEIAGAIDAELGTIDAAGVERTRIVVCDGAAGSADALAAAAAAGDGRHLVLMDGPMIGLTHAWLRRLAGYSSQPRIAAAGPVVLAPDGRIAHAGVALPDGLPLFLLHGERSSMDRHFGYGTSVYDVSALSGVIATRRDVYDEVGGLNTGLGDYTLVEYCLRATAAGRRAVIVPDARLRILGPDRTCNDLAAIRAIQSRWRARHSGDPFYNPRFRADRGDLVIARD